MAANCSAGGGSFRDYVRPEQHDYWLVAHLTRLETRDYLHPLAADMLFNETIIEPGRSEQNYWRDLWRYPPEPLQVLAWRDLSVRYKQTLIGSATVNFVGLAFCLLPELLRVSYVRWSATVMGKCDR